MLAPALGVAADLALHDGDAARAVTLARQSLDLAGGHADRAFAAHSVLGDVALFEGDTERAVASWQASPRP